MQKHLIVTDGNNHREKRVPPIVASMNKIVMRDRCAKRIFVEKKEAHGKNTPLVHEKAQYEQEDLTRSVRSHKNCTCFRRLFIEIT